MKKNIVNPVVWCLVLLAVAPVLAVEPEANTDPVFKPEELEQILAPIAIYPDDLISQILMASTYPLEVVQADRWGKQNKDLKDDALATALEKETWDPSVKSLVNFPQVLTMMSEKLDWTQKLGDAFLAQQKEVMDTIQKLRKKAQDEGNLKTTEQQVVKVEQETIIIQSASPQVIYVPTYNPTVVYGTWPYPAYPPYYYYPPGYVATPNPGLAFASGVVLGAAWGHAWGNCNWRGGDVDININRNANFNQNINRGARAKQYQGAGRNGKGTWKHNPANRKGVAYRDKGTAQRFNRASTSDAVKSREAFRGRAEQGRRELAGGAGRGNAARSGNRATGVADRSKVRSNTGQRAKAKPTTRQPAARQSATRQPAARNTRSSGSSNRASAFQGMNRGSSARKSSSRGNASRQSRSRSSGGRSRGGGGGRRR